MQPLVRSHSTLPKTFTNLLIDLFGSDLEQRAEYEKTSIPGIVSRCVEEVEERGEYKQLLQND
jgi:hypothetical protein